MADSTFIPAPGTQLVDPKSGMIDQTWYQFLTQIFNRTGSDSGPITGIDALPPMLSTGGSSPTLSLREATAGQSGSMSSSDKAKLDLLTYEAGVWIPTISFDTPGNLNVVYGQRFGAYTRIGRTMRLDFSITTTTFTHTTAAGSLRISGVPSPASGLFPEFVGSISWAGLTFTGSTALVPRIVSADTSIVRLIASGTGVGRTQLTSDNTVSGTQITIAGHIEYFV